ncbi:hypothetical protein BFP70_08255 [Thioclava sp. SK-1]|nr:hypothetical protein BFP70_08255 [Thioclava sp. SK-1]
MFCERYFAHCPRQTLGHCVPHLQTSRHRLKTSQDKTQPSAQTEPNDVVPPLGRPKGQAAGAGRRPAPAA